MSIETLLNELKDALDRNTVALTASVGKVAPATQPEVESERKKPGRPSKDEKKDEPKITQEQVNAALIKIKDDFGMDAARAVIKEVGDSDKMAEIKPAKFQAVYDAAIAKHAELSSAKADDGGI